MTYDLAAVWLAGVFGGVVGCGISLLIVLAYYRIANNVLENK